MTPYDAEHVQSANAVRITTYRLPSGDPLIVLDGLDANGRVTPIYSAHRSLASALGDIPDFIRRHTHQFDNAFLRDVGLLEKRCLLADQFLLPNPTDTVAGAAELFGVDVGTAELLALEALEHANDDDEMVRWLRSQRNRGFCLIAAVLSMYETPTATALVHAAFATETPWTTVVPSLLDALDEALR